MSNSLLIVISTSTFFQHNALFLLSPFTSEKQLGADLLVLEDFIAITPAVDIQQKTRGRKRASMLEESEVDITISSELLIHL